LEIILLRATVKYAPGNRGAMLVIAHRGASSVAPENSMEAFRKAIELGADGIELDVRTTSDGVAIIMHDPDLKRTAGMRMAVSRAEMAHLCKARLANGEAVPTLEGVLDALGGAGIIYAELKDRKSAPEAERLAAKYPGATVIASSFDARALAGAKRLPKALLWDKRGSPVSAAIRSGCGEIHQRLRRATPRMVRESHAHELKVILWDVRNPLAVARALEIDADGIIVDDVPMAEREISK
jgi:glycerophosphoryl diester phosphodiesterase